MLSVAIWAFTLLYKCYSFDWFGVCECNRGATGFQQILPCHNVNTRRRIPSPRTHFLFFFKQNKNFSELL